MKAVHLAPYDGIGGVETAMRTMPASADATLAFERLYLTNETGQARTQALNNPLQLFRLARRVVRMKPDIVIASLWRAVFVALLVKLLAPHTRLVTFLHCPEAVHFPDRLAHALAIPLSVEIWADSDATRRKRLSARALARSRTVSFKLRNLDPANPSGDPSPHFVFWGRLHEHKDLERAIGLFSSVHRRYPAASFRIVGPDGGELDRLESIVAAHHLGDAVQFPGARDLAGLRQEASRASFYLQTSSLEGMAMSVMEAMQFALVPVVTPVGAIGDYCHDGENSIIVRDDAEATVERIVEALETPQIYSALRDGARRTWQVTPLYHEDVAIACHALISRLGATRSSRPTSADRRA